MGSWRPWGIATRSTMTKASFESTTTTNPSSFIKGGRWASSRRRRQRLATEGPKGELNRALLDDLEPATNLFLPARGGGVEGQVQPLNEDRLNGLVRLVGTLTQALISCGRTVLPPTVGAIKAVMNFYRGLPQDAIVAQVGLVYCFAGGYYPTLFSCLQAARHCGWEVAQEAIHDLTDEAIKVIEATADLTWDDLDGREVFLRQTNIVLKTVDPMKINQAAAALYTTWLGVSAVLEKEYVRVIALSVTMANYLERGAHWILEPPVKLVVPKDYHRWVPVTIGWICKGVAMNIAWRIQRVLTASTSAMVGGLMFARAILRILHKNGVRLFGWIDETGQESPLDDILGFTIASIGFWTQMEAQFQNNFSFEVPFPISLVTWPFDYIERAIQWAITN